MFFIRFQIVFRLCFRYCNRIKIDWFVPSGYWGSIKGFSSHFLSPAQIPWETNYANVLETRSSRYFCWQTIQLHNAFVKINDFFPRAVRTCLAIWVKGVHNLQLNCFLFNSQFFLQLSIVVSTVLSSFHIFYLLFSIFLRRF